MLGHPTRRPARAAALAAVATLALSACGASDDSDAAKGGSSALAATVGGEEITVGEVQQSTRELRTYVAERSAASGQEPQQLDVPTVVTYLTQTPAVLEYAEAEGIDVPSAATVRQDVADALTSPSDLTVDFLRANAVAGNLDETAQQELSQRLADSDVTLSPRYATALGEGPDWLEAPAETEQQLQVP